MSRRSTLLRSAAASVILMTAQPVLADVTPQQVWDDLEAYLSSFGYTVTGTETTSGDVLTVSDFALTADIPEGDGSFTFNAEQVQFEDLGNGSVSIIFPASMAVAISVIEEPGAEPFELGLDYTHDALEMIVSGEPDDMVYDYSADRLGMALTKLVVDGEEMGSDAASADITLNEVAGTARVTVSDLRNISQSMTAAGMDYDVTMHAPENGNLIEFVGTMASPSIESTIALPLDADPEDMSAMLAAGFAVSGALSHEGGSGKFNGTENGQATSGQSSSSAGNMQMELNSDAMRYAASAMDVEMSLEGGELPFPVAAAIEESSVNLTMPTSKGEDESDVALGLKLAGFTMSDHLWDIFDAGKTLPRDPATIAFDLNGKVKMLVDLMNPEEMAAADQGEIQPVEPQSLTLSGLLIDAIGARITGEGAFTFDNTDLTTFDGMPRPEGTLNVTVDGANGVIDKLIQMGLMQEQDAMGARMMISMFSVPAGGEDQLKSTIEINEQGHVLANGQRIK